MTYCIFRGKKFAGNWRKTTASVDADTGNTLKKTKLTLIVLGRGGDFLHNLAILQKSARRTIITLTLFRMCSKSTKIKKVILLQTFLHNCSVQALHFRISQSFILEIKCLQEYYEKKTIIKKN